MNKIILITFLSLFLGACSTSKDTPDASLSDSSWLSISSFKPYKADIQQGSVLRRFAINQLKAGMSKRQVQDTIGQPSIIDPFHNNQWDYIHYTTLGSNEIVNYRLILTFTKDKLSNINTDGISSLPEMTDREKAKEVMNIAEKKRVEEVRIAKEEAEAKIAEEKRIAKVREEARLIKEEVKVKIEKEKRIAKEKATAKIEKEKRIAKEKTKAKIEEQKRIAKEKTKAKIEEQKRIAKEKTKAKIEEQNRAVKERVKAEIEERNRIAKVKEAEAEEVGIVKEKIKTKVLEERKSWYQFW
ncbi:MAG: outer membrane protein assembly factor BamE [Gammaproteobacteria bacterium]|nr:outer membrane protein assembly factor BamE [Gammaproteobacteria bacterium]